MEILRSKLSQAHNGCQKGKKCLRNHRKMTKKHAKKWLNKEMEEKNLDFSKTPLSHNLSSSVLFFFFISLTQFGQLL